MYAKKLKCAAACAAMIIGLSGASYAGDLDTFLFGIGTSGFQAAKVGDYRAADRDFTADYRNNPNDGLAEFNMADVYNRRGDKMKADALYRQAAINGRAEIPAALLEPHASGSTVADAACFHLRQDGADTSVCGNSAI